MHEKKENSSDPGFQMYQEWCFLNRLVDYLFGAVISNTFVAGSPEHNILMEDYNLILDRIEILEDKANSACFGEYSSNGGFLWRLEIVENAL